MNYSLRLWIGVATIPAIAGYTVAVVQEQQALNAQVAIASAGNHIESSPAQHVAEQAQLEIGLRSPGWRAISIRAGAESSVPPQPAGRPHALSRVDVVVFYKDGGKAAEILLEDVLVMEVEPQTPAGQLPLVTLALRAEDELKLRLAQQTGTISLALRNTLPNKR